MKKNGGGRLRRHTTLNITLIKQIFLKTTLSVKILRRVLFYKCVAEWIVLSPKQIRKKFGDIALYENRQNNQRQNIGHINPCPFRETDTAACVRFVCEILPAPAAFGGAEQQIDKRAERQNVVADYKIFQIHNGTAFAQRLYTA